MLSFSAVLPVLQRAVKWEKMTTYINGRPHMSTINTKSVSNPDDSAAREPCRSLVSSWGVPVGESLTAVLLYHLSSSSKHTGVRSTWERNTDQQGMLSTSWAPPTRWWALASTRLPQLLVGKPSSLPCSVHLPPVLWLSFIPASSSPAPRSTNRCPSYCIWDFPFYRPLCTFSHSPPTPHPYSEGKRNGSCKTTNKHLTCHNQQANWILPWHFTQDPSLLFTVLQKGKIFWVSD